MTKEEALDVLIYLTNCEDVNTRHKEAIEIAIEALEQQSCDICISRQAVLDTLDNHKYSKEFCEEHHIDWSINLSMARIAINDLPSVTPKEKTGIGFYILKTM